MVLRSCWKSRHKTSCGPARRWIPPGTVALFWMCATQFVCSSGTMVGETKYVQKEAEFDVTYNDTVTSQNQTIYAFNHTISRNEVGFPGESTTSGWADLCPWLFLLVCQTEGVRVSVDVMQQQLESPILFVIRQKQAVVSFQVPLILRGLWVKPLFQ